MDVQEKLLLREQLWQSRVELQQQADFCSGLGSAACSLLWSCSAKEDTVSLWLADVSHLQSFLSLCMDLDLFSCNKNPQIGLQGYMLVVSSVCKKCSHS